MRLIDADYFKQQVAAVTLKDNIEPKKGIAPLELIDTIPTAYDTDKVIEQIRQIPENYSDNDIDSMIDDVVELVRSEIEG